MKKQQLKSQPNSRVRRPPLSRFAKNLRAAWKEMALPTGNATVVIGVSGGADSTALLLALDELIKNDKLQVKLIVAHLDHGLRKGSAADARWVTRLGNDLGHKVVIGSANLKTPAGKPVANLEQAARLKRYDFLLRTATKHQASLVLTAHTLDDQAETVLLRLLRGSAAEGLSGTLAVRPIKNGSAVMLSRPLVSWARRSDTEEYSRVLGVQFRVDEMNDDETFSRVRIRKQLLPLMESFNARIVEALGRTASLLGEDATVLSDQAGELLKLAIRGFADNQPENFENKLPALSVKVLLQAPAAVRRRALRQWLANGRGNLKRLEMSHLLAVEKLLTGRGGSIVELPGSFRVTRNRQFLKVFNSKSAAPRVRQTGKPVLLRKKGLKKAAATSKISGR
jgi:tRNA(Ile)-lysidine synthase